MQFLIVFGYLYKFANSIGNEPHQIGQGDCMNPIFQQLFPKYKLLGGFCVVKPHKNPLKSHSEWGKFSMMRLPYPIR